MKLPSMTSAQSSRKPSHPVRGAWIEIILPYLASSKTPSSHPVRGAWIEMDNAELNEFAEVVAPRQGCVD